MELVEAVWDRIESDLPKSLFDKTKKHLRKHVLNQFRTKKDIDELENLTPLQFYILVDNIYEDYQKSLVEPGKMVGVIAAQTMGEIQTQATMETHKTPGQSSGREMFSGLPKILEVVQTRQTSNPMMFLYPRERKTIAELKKLIPKLTYTIIHDVISSFVISKSDEKQVERKSWHTDFENMFGKVEVSEFILRIHFDVKKLRDKNLTLSFISEQIKTYVVDVDIIYSSLFVGIMDIYYNGKGKMLNYESFAKQGQTKMYYIRDFIFPQIKGIHICGISNVSNVYFNTFNLNQLIKEITEDGKIKIKKDLMRKKGIQEDWVKEWLTEQLTDNNNGETETIKSQNGYFQIMFPVSTSQARKLITRTDVKYTELLDKHGQISQQKLDYHGLVRNHVMTEVNQSTTSQDLDTITFCSKRKSFLSEFWFIETSGINMKDVKYIPDFNHNCTWCNSRVEIEQYIGRFAYQEYMPIALEEGGVVGIEKTHSSILCDTATRGTQFVGMTRLGLEMMDVEFLTKGNFEKNSTIFIETAMMGRTDNIASVASSVITGNLAKMGSGFSDVVVPDEKITYQRRKTPRRPPLGLDA